LSSGPAAAPNRGHAFAAALFQELVRAGVRDAVVCPGSRSTALAVSAAHCPELRCWPHVDERSAGFFALGLAKAARRAVALVCTSGTAAANFFPAVVEAHYARVPLVVLSADRPPELREWGAGQTIDQLRLYGSHVRWFAEAPLPDASPSRLRHARALACRAGAEAAGPPAGPVHLNLPFREPLEPVPVPGDVPAPRSESEALALWGRAGRPYTETSRRVAAPSPAELDALAERALASPHGAIACGPVDASPELVEAVADLGRAAGWPILADPTSQLRCGPHTATAPVIAGSDLFLRDERFAARHAPEFVLRIGGTPTSKAFRAWLERHATAHVALVDPDGDWSDPLHLASQALRVDPAALCHGLGRRIAERTREPRGPWLHAFLEAERRTAEAVACCLLAGEEWTEPRAVVELAAVLPPSTLLYVSNSMPVRDLDGFLPTSTRSLRVLCNRGANGIDGMISSALGAAAAGCGRVVLLTGDLAFLHDLGGLAAVRRHRLEATVVVLNNDGGGIFSFLPVSGYGKAAAFEEHFLMPHGLDIGPLARAFGASFTRVTSAKHFRACVEESLSSPGTAVIEVPVRREHSVARHREIERSVAASVAEGIDAVGREP
jgi:2-succinyl-5-enolpyruvyl-6-hydroxy-3-cyclohexene-1-carboxylate synthase